MKITACYFEPQRRKTRADDVMRAFAESCKGRIVKTARYAHWADQHAFIGPWLTAIRLIPEATLHRKPYFYIDSAFIRPADNTPCYCRLTRNGYTPEIKAGLLWSRVAEFGVDLKPWRQSGSYILALSQGPNSGRPWNLKPNDWLVKQIRALKGVTDRPVRTRLKADRHLRPLAEDLKDAWCVLTHSSTAAVTAAIAGVPVFCSRWCPAAAVGCEDITRIEDPVRPDREDWLASLVWQQYGIEEMRQGLWRTVF